MRCVGCGYDGAVPADVQARLQVARTLLHQMDARQRQLSGLRQIALRQSGWFVLIFVAMFVVYAGMFAGCGGLCAWLGGEAFDDFGSVLWLGGLMFFPTVVFLVFGLAALGAVRRTRRKLQDACAATVPERPGEPASCHVCGAPLTAPTRGAVVRCTYCAADNVVDPEAMARAGRARSVDVAHLERAVRDRASTTSTVAVGGMMVLPLLCLIAPPLAMAAWIAIMAGVDRIEGPLDTSLRYVLVDTPDGRCVARFQADKSGAKRVQLGRRQVGKMNPPSLPSTPQHFDAAWLVGKKVKIVGDSDGKATVTGVYSPSLVPGTCQVKMKYDRGTETQVDILIGVCLAD
jgi:hypothetical protein